MTARVMDGMALRAEMIAAIRAEIEADGVAVPCLATVVVGDNPRCHIFARDKRSAAADAGMTTVTVDLTAAATQGQVEEAIAGLATDPGVHGIFVQLPLPQDLDPDRIGQLIPVGKDVDGMRPDSRHAPTAPLAVIRLLERHQITISGRQAVIVGGTHRAMALLLTHRGADVTIVDDASPAVCRQADILVAASGRARSIGPGHVRPGAAVVDVTGAVDTEAVLQVAAAIAPYPAAVGPVAVACLLANTLDSAGTAPASRATA